MSSLGSKHWVVSLTKIGDQGQKMKCNTKLRWRIWSCDMPKSLARLSLTNELWLSGGDEVNGGVITTNHVVHKRGEGLVQCERFCEAQMAL